MNPKNGEGDDDELISTTAYGAPYLVAAKANMYMLGAGYTDPGKQEISEENTSIQRLRLARQTEQRLQR